MLIYWDLLLQLLLVLSCTYNLHSQHYGQLSFYWSPEIPKPVNGYLRKIRNVNRKLYHLYSFQHLIVPNDIYAFYPVYLLTCLGHPYHTKLEWIQRTRLCIYASLDEAKSDPSHPVWSVVNTRFLCKCPSLLGHRSYLLLEQFPLFCIPPCPTSDR